jgi:LysM repeat protein
MPVPRLRTALATAVVASVAFAAPARGGVPHRVLPGETLWSIAASNNFTTRTIAAFNGLSVDSPVYAGNTIQIPTEAEGAAALASAGVASSGTTAASGSSGASHTVTRGESLRSIADANGVSLDTLAAENGLSSDSLLYIGQTIKVPFSSSSTSSSGTGVAIGPPPPPEHPYWTSPIYCPSCPSGEAYLASNAAANWDAMRQASLSEFGIDLYPAGPLSAYRSYAQQLYLYNLYLAGQGGLAAMPGTSSHEYGIALDLDDPSMRTVVDEIGANYGWAKTEAPEEWWHVNYTGP